LSWNIPKEGEGHRVSNCVCALFAGTPAHACRLPKHHLPDSVAVASLFPAPVGAIEGSPGPSALGNGINKIHSTLPKARGMCGKRRVCACSNSAAGLRSPQLVVGEVEGRICVRNPTLRRSSRLRGQPAAFGFRFVCTAPKRLTVKWPRVLTRGLWHAISHMPLG
jgi:hypothetical protein